MLTHSGTNFVMFKNYNLAKGRYYNVITYTYVLALQIS